MDFNKVVFTNHALKKGREMGLSEKKLRSLLNEARQLKINFWRQVYKFFKYGLNQSSITYHYRVESKKYPPILFTVDEKELPVVITVTLKEGRV